MSFGFFYGVRKVGAMDRKRGAIFFNGERGWASLVCSNESRGKLPKNK